MSSEWGRGTKITYYFLLQDFRSPSGIELESDSEIDEKFQLSDGEFNRVESLNKVYKEKEFALKGFMLRTFESPWDFTSLAGLRILCVDDMVFNIEAMKVILMQLGIDVERQLHSAENGYQALEQVMN